MTLQYNLFDESDWNTPNGFIYPLPGLAWPAPSSGSPEDDSLPPVDVAWYVTPQSASVLLIADFGYPGNMSTCHVSGS